MLVLTISTLVIKTSNMVNLKVQELKLQQVPYIYYPAQFGKISVEVLIDLSSEINIINPSFARKLSLSICKIDMGTQKIDSSRLKTLEIMIISFQVDDKNRKSRFFEEIFLLCDISIDIAFGILFLTLSNVEVNFNY